MFTYDNEDTIKNYKARVYIESDDDLKSYLIQMDLWRAENIQEKFSDFEDDVYLTYKECPNPDTAIDYAWNNLVDWVEQLEYLKDDE